MSKNKYRLISVFGIIAAIGVMGAGVVMFANKGAEIFSKSGVSNEISGKSFEATAASDLEIDGFWDITLKYGNPSISINADADQMKNIHFSQTGDIITLKQDSTVFSGFGHTVKLLISMPSIKNVSLNGAGSISISGITTEYLKLAFQGGCSANLKDLTVKNLVLETEGACNVDAKNSSITNATIKMQGASNASLNMVGGSLEGSIEGVGHLSYTGTVSNQNIRTDGLAKVEKK